MGGLFSAFGSKKSKASKSGTSASKPKRSSSKRRSSSRPVSRSRSMDAPLPRERTIAAGGVDDVPTKASGARGRTRPVVRGPSPRMVRPTVGTDQSSSSPSDRSVSPILIDIAPAVAGAQRATSTPAAKAKPLPGTSVRSAPAARPRTSTPETIVPIFKQPLTKPGFAATQDYQYDLTPRR